MAMVYDPELLEGDSSEELILEQPQQALEDQRHMRKVAIVGLALLGVAIVAVLTAPAAGAGATQEAMPSGVVSLVTGTLSTGVDPKLKGAELHGCCPMTNGRYLDCCSQEDQCCPKNNITVQLACCSGAAMPPLSKRCVGLKVSSDCAVDSACCDGRCASNGSICCGDLICGEGSTCCRNSLGTYSCGAPHSKCGGDIGGVPLRSVDWPNPSTPTDWYNTSQNGSKWGETLYRTPKSDKPLSPQECANLCGLHGSCCGKICCGKGATCCLNQFSVHSCGAPGSVCGGDSHGGGPLHEDTYGYVEPAVGETVFRVTSLAPGQAAV